MVDSSKTFDYIFWLQFQLDGENASGEEDEIVDEEGRERDGREVCVHKAFHKWQDHRPSFQDMHSEDRKRRPR